MKRYVMASLIACGLVGVLLLPVGLLRLLVWIGAPDFVAALSMVLGYAVFAAISVVALMHPGPEASAE